jgi:hypothetical protein
MPIQAEGREAQQIVAPLVSVGCLIKWLYLHQQVDGWPGKIDCFLSSFLGLGGMKTTICRAFYLIILTTRFACA